MLYYQKSKRLVLGTALWGWGVDKKTAFQTLEAFIEKENLSVDVATNYPINGREKDFGTAIKWLVERLELNPCSTLEINLKLGAKDNLGTPESDLTPQNIDETINSLPKALKENLAILSVHWDNRNDESEIHDTIDTLFRASLLLSCELGFSGVKSPQYYASSPININNKWHIQVKENAITNNARSSYEPWFPDSYYYAYGINLGGVKNGPTIADSSVSLRKINQSKTIIKTLNDLLLQYQTYEIPPENFNQLALLLAEKNPRLSGVIIGPRNPGQLLETMNYWDSINNES